MSISLKTFVSPSDKQIRDLFYDLEKATKVPANFTIAGLSNPVGKDDEKLIKAVKGNVDIIVSALLQPPGITIHYQARHHFGNSQGSTVPHPYYSCISTNVNDSYGQTPPADQNLATECQVIIGQFIKKNSLDPGLAPRADEKILDPHLALVSKLESSATEQVTRVNEFFQELVERFDARNLALEQSFDERRASLETEIAGRQRELDEARHALEEKQREMDDRTNTHARRAIRGELITTLKARQSSFAISADTKRLRWPIHVVFILLLIASGAGAAWSLYVWGTNLSDAYGAIMVLGALKAVVFSFTFITTAGLYVSWMNRWFDKHADAQFQTKQFEIDINRATWAVEAALEWKGAQGEQMPDVLLSGITKHLFEVSAAESTEYSPLEALASSILGAASNLKLDVNGSKLDFDRKSLKEISKKSE